MDCHAVSNTVLPIILWQLKADRVLVAVGLEPSVDLAVTSGLEVDSNLGGFLVNSELEARSNLWVVSEHLLKN